MLHAFAFALAAALAAGGAPPPDARRGEALFSGAAPLEHGGAPCLGCHGIARHGVAFTARFGPDLSDLGQTYDPAALESVLADVPFPSMAPVYERHPLSGAERADLAAFLLGPHGAGPDASGGAVVAIAGAIAAALVGGSALLARRTFRPVRAAIGARARRNTGGTR